MISIKPADLICLQEKADMKIPYPKLPLLTKDTGVKNIALEWDPEWSTSYSPDDDDTEVDDLLTAGVKAAERIGARFWVIDYQLKQVKATKGRKFPPIPKDRAVFYGKGCRFVEVKSNDKEWDTGNDDQ